MSQSVLVIGGTRYFGVRLVERLLDAGHRVTLATRGRVPDPFGARVARVRLDRRDEAAMSAAFARRRFDLVVDQVCYRPGDAALAGRVFAGRVGRYLMTSTLEVYEVCHGRLSRPYRETDIDLDAERLDSAQPWGDTTFAEAHYGLGKRLAEAQLARTPGLPWASLRLGHVLGGPEDFTGRLQGHVREVLAGQPLRHAAAAGVSSFIDVEGVVDFMLWAGRQDFLGPINVGSPEAFSVVELRRRIGERLGCPVIAQAIEHVGPSAFDYAAPHALDVSRAETLGWRFQPVQHWLGPLIDRHARALAKWEVSHEHA